MSDALLIVGHGSRTREDDVLPYYVDFFKGTGRFKEVLACYLEREPKVDGILKNISADRVFVMPFLVSHGYHTKVTIPEALGIKTSHDSFDGKEIIYLEPLGRSEHIARLIQERIEETM